MPIFGVERELGRDGGVAQQVYTAKSGRLGLWVKPHRHRVESHAARHHLGDGQRQRRRREVNRRLKHIQPVDTLFQQRFQQACAPLRVGRRRRPQVVVHNCLHRRHQQCARAARQVRQSERAHCIGGAPVYLPAFGLEREAQQQGRRRHRSVVSAQRLGNIAQQQVIDAPCQVVSEHHALAREVAHNRHGLLKRFIQQRIGRERSQNRTRQMEHGVVVYFRENFAPLVQQGVVHGACLTALLQVAHARLLTG